MICRRHNPGPDSSSYRFSPYLVSIAGHCRDEEMRSAAQNRILSGSLLAGELAMLEQEAGIGEGKAPVLTMKHARGVVGQIVFLSKTHELTDEIEG